MRTVVAVSALLCSCLILSTAAAAQLAAAPVRGVIHDPQHRPLAGAQVTLRAAHSQWSATATTSADGEFVFRDVSLGDYTLSASHTGFAAATEDLTVVSGANPVVHVELQVAGASQTVTVTAAPEEIQTDTPTPTTLIDHEDIERTPGAARADSLAMITDFVPGADVVHDMLHVRGGHQTTWLIDGVPMINTAIASNVGPQFDPQDLDYVEAQRGSYSAAFGDRTYGIFNAVPRTGFESNNQAELSVTAGTQGQTDDHLSFASHTDRFAYYASLNGNRSDLGLQTPVPQTVHDAENGFGGFGSLIFNLDASNQFRFVATARRDFFQIPYDPNPDDIENGAIAANNFTPQWQSIGLRDSQTERDTGLNFSWIHTFQLPLVLTVSPFYHYNSGDYAAPPTDTPVATTQDLASNYGGVQATLAGHAARNDFQFGELAFEQQDSQRFGAIFNDGSGTAPVNDTEHPSGNLEAVFVDDNFQPVPWLSITAGVRPTRFSGTYPGSFTETSVSPRVGAAVTLPWVHWTARAFYGHYYQAPPLETISGPALTSFVQGQGLTFEPLHGEFDKEFQYGLDIPYRGWVLDTDAFRTNARNFLDHNNIGDSSIFFPLTVSQALIRAWELTLRSPRFYNRGQFHLAFSNQIAEGSGTITGGLTNLTVIPTLQPLDHDQRDTLNLGGDFSLPRNSYISANLNYGSGFTNGLRGEPYPGAYLPSHTTLDLALGKNFGEKLSASVNVLNATNQRVEMDNSLTFGGFHWNAPRQAYVQLNYRFKY